jgi:hypothetical protein
LNTDSNGNKTLNPDKNITRYEAIKVMMLAYNSIQHSDIYFSGSSVMGDIINKDNPYYTYIRQAEAL